MKKTCRRCQEEKDVCEFHKSKSGKFGVMAICKKCDNKRSTEHVRKLADDKRKRGLIKAQRLTLVANEDIKKGKKYCPSCTKVLPVSHFYSNKASNDGCSSHCDKCSRKIARNIPPEQIHKYYVTRKRKQRNFTLLRKYGITIEQYEKIFDKQCGKCAICGLTAENNKKALAVDHCHSTNTVRGLLCNNCNVAIGFLGDSVKKAKKAIAYLKK